MDIMSLLTRQSRPTKSTHYLHLHLLALLFILLVCSEVNIMMDVKDDQIITNRLPGKSRNLRSLLIATGVFLLAALTLSRP